MQKSNLLILVIINLSISLFIALINPSTYAFQNATEYNFYNKWGSEGKGDGQFQRPHDLDFSPDEKILYAVDRDGNRIQAFDKNGTFLFSWGKLGNGDGQFHVPYGIDVDINGNVWVVDRANDRVQKFDSKGNFITKWGSYGENDGQVRVPEHLAVHSEGHVYVSDRKNENIQVFEPVQ